MEKVWREAPWVLEIAGICLLWLLKASLFTAALFVVIVWNLIRIALAGFFFGRLPRSYIRAFD